MTSSRQPKFLTEIVITPKAVELKEEKNLYSNGSQP